MEKDLAEKLKALAHKYETASFIEKDPSQFMHRYSRVTDQEVTAFIAANLAFGRRDQILKHVEQVLAQTEGSPAEWIKSGAYEKFFGESDDSFYRMYTYRSMKLFCRGLQNILFESEKKFDGTVGAVVKSLYQKQKDKNPNLKLHHTIASLFPSDCNLISHGKDSASKKLNMMLRWLVRDNSPVDLGLWNWYKKTDLIMPLDTHVIQEATSFGIFPLSASGKPQSANLKSAVALTETMKEVFPEDPLKGDFALFGLGVDGE